MRERLHVPFSDVHDRHSRFPSPGLLLVSLGGWVSSAGDSAYEVQQAVGGKAHDDALAIAVQEGKEHFHQCARCGRWVCPEVCWNQAAGQCKDCAPDFQQELASAHAQAKADAARQQLMDKAQQTDFVSDIDMKKGSVLVSRNIKAVRQRRVLFQLRQRTRRR